MHEQHFKGGTHYHYYNPPQQQELEFVNKDALISARFYPKEKELITKLAEQRNRKLSDFIRDLVLRQLKAERALNEIRQKLDDIL